MPLGDELVLKDSTWMGTFLQRSTFHWPPQWGPAFTDCIESGYNHLAGLWLMWPQRRERWQK
jgi:hypothetical protein